MVTFKDVKIKRLGRIAACGIAAFFLVLPTLSSRKSNAFADGDGSAAGVIATKLDYAQDRSHNDAQIQAKLAALDPIKSQTVERAVFRSPNLVEPFGLRNVSVEGGEFLTKWTAVRADIRAEREILARCRESAVRCPPAAQKFLAIIADGQAHTGRARIGVINRAINLAINPVRGLAQRAMSNHWNSPLAALSLGNGDCKDYAVAKYVALREAGIADDDVRIVIVHNLATDEDHAIVTARLDGNWIVLDNRWMTLVYDSEMRRVIPLFVLDRDGVEQFALVTTQNP